jgi:hypothetical protein
MGVVLMGRDSDLGHDLAVKVLLDRLGDDPVMVCWFIEVVQVGGQLQQRGVVPDYDPDSSDGTQLGYCERVSFNRSKSSPSFLF